MFYAITWKDNDITSAMYGKTATQYAKDYEEVKRHLEWLEIYNRYFVLVKIELCEK